MSERQARGQTLAHIERVTIAQRSARLGSIIHRHMIEWPVAIAVALSIVGWAGGIVELSMFIWIAAAIFAYSMLDLIIATVAAVRNLPGRRKEVFRVARSVLLSRLEFFWLQVSIGFCLIVGAPTYLWLLMVGLPIAAALWTYGRFVVWQGTRTRQKRSNSRPRIVRDFRFYMMAALTFCVLLIALTGPALVRKATAPTPPPIKIPKVLVTDPD